MSWLVHRGAGHETPDNIILPARGAPVLRDITGRVVVLRRVQHFMERGHGHGLGGAQGLQAAAVARRDVRLAGENDFSSGQSPAVSVCTF